MGFDDAIRRLHDLQRRAEELDGEHSVPMSELLSDDFMLRNTDFPSIGEMFAASGFTAQSQEDFAAIPDDQWDAFVRERTRFGSWKEMKGLAVQEWAARRLGLE
jgi:hypothetical protein